MQLVVAVLVWTLLLVSILTTQGRKNHTEEQVQIPHLENYRVHGFDVLGANDEMYSGFMPLDWTDEDSGSFFFWLALQRHSAEVDTNKPRRLVIWLNGGPGCSSLIGMLWENGPFTVQDDSSSRRVRLQSNPFSWNEVADVLYVEQPLGTGFSAAGKTDLVSSQADVGRQFRRFLISFYTVFPTYRNAELFISGESYAGLYIPSIADHILEHQMLTLKSGEVIRDPTLDGINLSGLAIGNGVIDYYIQEQSYAPYAYYHGLISNYELHQLEKQWDACEKKFPKKEKLSRKHFERCKMLNSTLYAAGQPNQYDTRTSRQYDFISSPQAAFRRFLSDPAVQTAIHVRGTNLPGLHLKSVKNDSSPYTPEWNVCNDDIEASLEKDRAITAVPMLQRIIDMKERAGKKARDRDTGVRVLIYAGDADMNCNFLGIRRTLEENLWLGRPWSNATRSLWRYQNDIAGEYSTFDDRFSFLVIRNSGHLVPMDVPGPALDLIHRFIGGKTFTDVMLPLPSDEFPVPPGGDKSNVYNDDDHKSSMKSSSKSSDLHAVLGVGGIILLLVLILGCGYRWYNYGYQRLSSNEDYPILTNLYPTYSDTIPPYARNSAATEE